MISRAFEHSLSTKHKKSIKSIIQSASSGKWKVVDIRFLLLSIKSEEISSLRDIIVPRIEIPHKKFTCAIHQTSEEREIINKTLIL